MGRYCTTILLGAFLLFQVQPQIAKCILPWFGGGTAVWSTCMLFFQVLLLGGYAYAHLLSRRLQPRRQAVLHISLLAVSLAFLPITPGEHWKPAGDENPTGHILLLLLATVGMPYLLLAATGPLLQSWFAREFEGRSPYRLYALSNVGSLAALLSFPFLFEPNLSIGIQANVWSGSFVAFALLCTWCAVRSAAPARAPAAPEGEVEHPSTDHEAPEWDPAPAGMSGGGGVAIAIAPETATASSVATTESQPITTVAAPKMGDQLLWIALAALPSVMLLAVTNAICLDIAVVPFFWVMPLSIYLLTFILTFDSERWYRRGVMAPLLAGSTLFVFTCAPASWFVYSVSTQVVASAASLFFCGMVCHGELVKLRPAPAHLTGFYLLISLGGALGGLFVALLAPLLFSTYAEVEIGMVACLVAAVYAARRCRVEPAFRRCLLRVVLPVALSLGVVVGIGMRVLSRDDHIEQSRNFFGRLTVDAQVMMVAHEGGMAPVQTTSLTHGRTVHGRQAYGPGVRPGQGMTYYWPGSGVAYALRKHPAAGVRPLRVGVIGLGAGTLAHYARAGDHYTFYEINPEIQRVAEARFTYLADARRRGATLDHRLGDARIQLERELKSGGSQGYDVLVVDAFSSDAIPVHLLTRECNKLYWQHLTAGGLLLVHISNRHLDLIPVVRGMALDARKEFRSVLAQIRDIGGPMTAQWVILTDNQEFLSREEMKPSNSAAAKTVQKRSLLWTDAFSSLWHVLK